MASKKGLTIKIEADEIMYTNVSKSKDSYNSARMVAKISDKVYMSISVEWEGSDSIPSFAMDLMNLITASKEEIEQSKKEKAEEFAAYKDRNK